MFFGVTVTVPVIAEAVLFVAVKEAILPVPLAASPMAVLLLAHEYSLALIPEKLMAVEVAPLQRTWLDGCVTVGTV